MCLYLITPPLWAICLLPTSIFLCGYCSKELIWFCNSCLASLQGSSVPEFPKVDTLQLSFSTPCCDCVVWRVQGRVQSNNSFFFLSMCLCAELLIFCFCFFSFTSLMVKHEKLLLQCDCCLLVHSLWGHFFPRKNYIHIMSNFASKSCDYALI